jgi:hypothetical protein
MWRPNDAAPGCESVPYVSPAPYLDAFRCVGNEDLAAFADFTHGIEVDVYAATFSGSAGTFDGEAWEAQKHIVFLAPTRNDWKVAWRRARCILRQARGTVPQ